jgi:hypothetical protein
MDFKEWIENFDDCFLCNLTPHLKCENEGLSKSLSVNNEFFLNRT